MARIDLESEQRVLAAIKRIGCVWAREIPGPTGRTSDFLAMREETHLALHVKELALDPEDQGSLPTWALGMSRVRRSVLVGVVLESARARVGTESRSEARAFLSHGAIGEEHIVRSDDRSRAAILRILGPAPAARKTVRLLIEADAQPDRDVWRIRRLLDRAFAQFMPRMTNLIVLAGPHDRWLALDHALLGRPIERWDLFPKRGERIAVGRSDDSFWATRARPESGALLWVPTSGRGVEKQPTLWIRGGARLNLPEEAMLLDLRDALA
ncbi:MAG: hypothetical protein O2800_02285 [Planctomycetota bacterium]|nr:hypothetical protein [Planctomycetota bacterium]